MNQVIEKVKKSISAHKTTFEEKEAEEQKTLFQKSEAMATKMVSQGGHKTNCPACKAVSWVTGEEVARQEPKLEDGQLVERTAMLPMNFECLACGLKLSGHSELQVAEIGRQFTRSIRYDPIEYYVGAEMGEEYDNE